MLTFSVPSLIKKAMPAVVSVVVTKHLEQIEKEMAHEYFPFLNFGPGREQLNLLRRLADSRGMVEVGGGSGFIVDESGIIITNRHVIADPKAEYTVLTNSNQKFTAEILARDPISDIAVLRLHATDETKGKIKKLPVISLGDSTQVELGEPIIAIGNSLGIFRNTVSAGIISGLSRAIQAQVDPATPPQEMRGLIQTDAAINPGNSGGPLLNSRCQVVGINTAIVFGAQNIGFAIPINTVKRDLTDLKKFGHIRRPFFGIRYLTIDDKLKDKMKLHDDYGAFIISEDYKTPGVIKDSPAFKAGLREKDVILEFNDHKITRDKTVQDHLEKASVGDSVTLKVRRDNGEISNLKLILTERK